MRGLHYFCKCSKPTVSYSISISCVSTSPFLGLIFLLSTSSYFFSLVFTPRFQLRVSLYARSSNSTSPHLPLSLLYFSSCVHSSITLSFPVITPSLPHFSSTFFHLLHEKDVPHHIPHFRTVILSYEQISRTLPIVLCKLKSVLRWFRRG